jgi:hypothetical protein
MRLFSESRRAGASVACSAGREGAPRQAAAGGTGRAGRRFGFAAGGGGRGHAGQPGNRLARLAHFRRHRLRARIEHSREGGIGRYGARQRIRQPLVGGGGQRGEAAHLLEAIGIRAGRGWLRKQARLRQVFAQLRAFGQQRDHQVVTVQLRIEDQLGNIADLADQSRRCRRSAWCAGRSWTRQCACAGPRSGCARRRAGTSQRLAP